MTAEQARYQVRFDWGRAGLAAVADDADVVVWVDALEPDSTTRLGLPTGNFWVVSARVPSAHAVASWIVELQEKTGTRVVVAVIAAGAHRSGGDFRFAVEDLLAAGAVIAELGQLGLDATSPEAAAAEASYLGLQRAVSHLLSASVSAQSVGAAVPPAIGKIDPALTSDDVEVLSQPA